MDRQSSAREIMVDNVITLSPEMTLHDAWECLFENRISGAPVVDHNGHVVGVLSQTDLVRETFAGGLSDFPSNSFYYDLPFHYTGGDGWKELAEKLKNVSVNDAMTSDPICVNASDSISTLARIMRTNRVHRLIITEDKKLIGIVTSLDLLKALEK
jgi:CBS domain-containing protein